MNVTLNAKKVLLARVSIRIVIAAWEITMHRKNISVKVILAVNVQLTPLELVLIACALIMIKHFTKRFGAATESEQLLELQ